MLSRCVIYRYKFIENLKWLFLSLKHIVKIVFPFFIYPSSIVLKKSRDSTELHFIDMI